MGHSPDNEMSSGDDLYALLSSSVMSSICLQWVLDERFFSKEP